MTGEQIGEAHNGAVRIIDRYAKSHHGAALLLSTLCQAEISMLGGSQPNVALQLFTEPLATKLTKLYVAAEAA